MSASKSVGPFRSRQHLPEPRLREDSAALTRTQLEELDRTAAELGHEAGPLRLALGDALNALNDTHRYHDLGFPTLISYAIERCGKPKRWIAESRALAASLAHLATLRRQLMAGRLSWTRAELLAKLVERSLASHDISNPDATRALRPALELSWLFRSSGMTCRELSERVRSLSPDTSSISTANGVRVLTLTVPSEDTWWFRAAERNFRRIAERRDLDAFLEAILAETHNTLHNCASLSRESEGFDARDRWRLQLHRWRTEAEHLCERARHTLRLKRQASKQRAASAWPTADELRTWPALTLNGHVISLAQRLHTNTFAFGHNAEQLHRAQAWRRFGFASPGHYARDHLGVSLSSLKQKRTLARRLMGLPQLAHALEQGHIGSVAASLVARIATSTTERRWVERARQRTIKHLREEIAFVERILRSRPGHRGLPPEPDVMRAELGLQGSIMSGRQFRPKPRPHYGAGLAQPPIEGFAQQHAERVAQQHDAERRREHLQRIEAYAAGVDASCSPPPPSDFRNGRTRMPADDVDRPPAAADRGDPEVREACVAPALAEISSRDGSRGQTSGCESHGNSAVRERVRPHATGREFPPYCPDPSDSSPYEPIAAPARYQCTVESTNTSRARFTRLTGDNLSLGNVRLRLRVYESTLLLYREVSRAFARQHPKHSLLRSLCEHFLTIWSPVIARKHQHKYQHIYERDGYTCTSPVCDRHDLTPHHLKFRSRGGGDESENLTSLCVWCHLEGVHGGRLRAEPRPNDIRWTIGRVAPLHVMGREKLTQ